MWICLSGHSCDRCEDNCESWCKLWRLDHVSSSCYESMRPTPRLKLRRVQGRENAGKWPRSISNFIKRSAIRYYRSQKDTHTQYQGSRRLRGISNWPISTCWTNSGEILCDSELNSGVLSLINHQAGMGFLFSIIHQPRMTRRIFDRIHDKS